MTTSTLSRIGIPPAPGRSTRPIPASGSRSSLWASPPWSHPELTFRSKAIEPVDEDTFRVIGDLSINGVTNDVELTAGLGGIETGPEGEKRLGLEVKRA